jgi:hypothetical protein
MSYLKLHRDEPEQPEPPAPIPFNSPDRTWRNTESAPTDSVTRVEEALSRVEQKFDELKEHADELDESFRMAEWLGGDDDDEPWAA